MSQLTPLEQVELELIYVLKDRPIWKAAQGDKFLNTADYLSDLIIEKVGELLGHAPMTRREVANYRLHELADLVHYLFHVSVMARASYRFRIAAPLHGSGLTATMCFDQMPADEEPAFYLDIQMEYDNKKDGYLWKIKEDGTVLIPKVEHGLPPLGKTYTF